MDDVGAVTKADVEAIFENSLTKWTSKLQSHIMKIVESTFEDALKASYFNSNIGLKNALLNVVEQALGQVV